MEWIKAQIIKVQVCTSKETGKPAYLLCFKGDDGKSYTSWVDSGFRNYKHWQNLMQVGNKLARLAVKNNGKTIDADSMPQLISDPIVPPAEVAVVEEPKPKLKQGRLM